MSTHRPAVRIVCIDGAGRILLLKWRDPHDGYVLWEPPGGGIEPGEAPLDAARRELHEETGLLGDLVQPGSIDVHRDVWWKGAHFVGPEAFFLARIEDTTVVPGDLRPDEVESLLEHRWFAWSEISTLDARLEPPDLAAVLTAFAPAGPWAGS